MPNGDTTGRFRNLLTRQGLEEQIFLHVVKQLEEKGLLLEKGTIVDSMLIEAPSSTKNRGRQRDPEAYQVKKGNEWHFGFKAHIGVDADSGLIHSLEATAVHVSDISQASKQVTGEDETVHGDSGYLGITRS